MKIVQILPSLSQGGAERLVVDLCNVIVQNHEVYLVTMFPKSNNHFYYNFLHSQVKVINLSKKMGFDPKMFGVLYKTIKSINPDVVHSHLRTVNYLTLSILLLRKIRFVHTIHNVANREAGYWIRKVRKLLIRSSLLYPVTISGVTDESFIEYYGIKKRKLIPNGRSVPQKSKQFHDARSIVKTIREKNPKCKIFVNIAGIRPQKNQECLIDLFGSMDNSNQLIIIGGDKFAPELYKRLLKKKTDNVHFMGCLENATDYLFLCDAFCLSSIYEGAPISLLEALAVGCIPICTPVGGIPNIMKHNIDGVLAKGTSNQDVKEAIEYYLSLSNSELEAFLNNAKETYINNYSIETCAKAYLKLWERLLNRKNNS